LAESAGLMTRPCEGKETCYYRQKCRKNH